MLKHRKNLLQELPDLFELGKLDLSIWKEARFGRFKDLLLRENFPEIEYFQTKVSRFNTLQYYQVRSLLTSLRKNNQMKSQLTNFEISLLTGSIFSKSFSKIYGILQEGEKIDDSYCKIWECDIGRPIERKHWYQTNAYMSKISANIAIRETYLKIRNRWYLVLTRLQKMFPEMDPKCWRCLKERGSMTHIWWSCPKVKRFWIAVNHEISI